MCRQVYPQASRSERQTRLMVIPFKRILSPSLRKRYDDITNNTLGAENIFSRTPIGKALSNNQLWVS